MDENNRGKRMTAALLLAAAMLMMLAAPASAEETAPNPAEKEALLIDEANAASAEGGTEEVPETAAEKPQVFSDEDYAKYRRGDFYSAEYVIPTGREIKEGFLRACIEKTRSSDLRYLSSALFVSECALESGLADAYSLSATPNADELYELVSGIDSAHRRNLKDVLQGTVGGTVSGSGCTLTGGLVFLTEGADACYRDEMSRKYDEYLAEHSEDKTAAEDEFILYPYHKNITYREVGICVGEGPGYILVVGLDTSMRPVIKPVSADECGDGAGIVIFEYEGRVEQLADYMALLTNLNDSAIAGIIANMYYESGLEPDTSGDEGTSYGLCQWHVGRKASFLEFCERKGLEASEMKSQVIYLAEELRTKYPDTLNYLRNLEDSPEGAYYAASRFCLWFENPSDSFEKAGFRGGAAERLFYGIVKDRAG